MEHSCTSCGVKSTCLKRSLGIFLLYIRTGRIDELTPEARENFCVAAPCEHWKPQPTQLEETT